MLYLRASSGAIHYGMTSKCGEGIPHLIETFRSSFISRIDNPAVGLQYDKD